MPVTSAGKVIISLAVRVGALLVPYELSQLAASLLSVEGDPKDRDQVAPPPAAKDGAPPCAACGEVSHLRGSLFCRTCGRRLGDE